MNKSNPRAQNANDNTTTTTKKPEATYNALADSVSLNPPTPTETTGGASLMTTATTQLGEAKIALQPAAAIAGPLAPLIGAVQAGTGIVNSMINSPWATNGAYMGGSADPAARQVLLGEDDTIISHRKTHPGEGYTSYLDDSNRLAKTNYHCQPVLEPGWDHFDLGRYFNTWRKMASGTLPEAVDSETKFQIDTDYLITTYATNDHSKIIQGLFTVPSAPSKFTYISRCRFALEFMLDSPTNIFDSNPIALSWLPPGVVGTALTKYLVPGIQYNARENSRTILSVPWFPVPETVSFHDKEPLGTLLLWAPLSADTRDAPTPYTLYMRINNIDLSRYDIPLETAGDDEARPRVDAIANPRLPQTPYQLADEKAAFCAVDMLASAHRLFTAERPISSTDLIFSDRVFSTITNSGLSKDVINFLWPVCPNALASRNNKGTGALTVHPLFVIAQYYSYWSGGLEFNFQLTSTATSCGKMQFIHHPINNYNRVPTKESIRSVFGNTLDINMGRSIRVTCNQKGTYKIRKCPRANSFEEAGLPVSNPMNFTSPGLSADQISHGWLMMMPLTTLALNNVPTAGVLEYVLSARGCDDLQFYQIVDKPPTMTVTAGDDEPRVLTAGDDEPISQQLPVRPTFDIAPSQDPMREIMALPVIYNNTTGAIIVKLSDLPCWPVLKMGYHFRGGARVRIEIAGPPMMTGKLDIIIYRNDDEAGSISYVASTVTTTYQAEGTVRQHLVVDVAKQRIIEFMTPYDYSSPLLEVDDNPVIARFEIDTRNIRVPLASAGTVRTKTWISLEENAAIYNMRGVSISDSGIVRTLAAPTVRTASDDQARECATRCGPNRIRTATDPSTNVNYTYRVVDQNNNDPRRQPQPPPPPTNRNTETAGDDEPRELCSLCDSACTTCIPPAKGIACNSSVFLLNRGRTVIHSERAITNCEYKPITNSFNLTRKWSEYLEDHYANNTHHPENSEFEANHNAHRICCLDVFSSITRTTTTIKQAYNTTVNVLSGAKFQAAHCCLEWFKEEMHKRFKHPVYGWSPEQFLREQDNTREWRNIDWIVQCIVREYQITAAEFLTELHNMPMGRFKATLKSFKPLAHCAHEVQAHIFNVTRLTKLFELEPELPFHDAHKLNKAVLITYFAKWGLNLDYIPLFGTPVEICPDYVNLTSVAQFNKTRGTVTAAPDTAKTAGGVSTKIKQFFTPTVVSKVSTMADNINGASDSVKDAADSANGIFKAIREFFESKFQHIKQIYHDLDPSKLASLVIEIVCAIVAVHQSESNTGRLATILQLLTSMGLTTKLLNFVYGRIKSLLRVGKVSKPALHAVVGEDEEITIKEGEQTAGLELGNLLRSYDSSSKLPIGTIIPLGAPFAIFGIIYAFFSGKESSTQDYFGFIKKLGAVARDFIAITSVSLFTLETLYIIIKTIPKIWNYFFGTIFPDADKLIENEKLYERIKAWLQTNSEFMALTPEEIIFSKEKTAELHQHAGEVDVLIQTVLDLQQQKKVSPNLLAFLTNAKRPIDELVAATHVARTACTIRKTPYAVRFIGKPGHGKTSIVPPIFTAVAAHHGYKAESANAVCYSWNVNDSFHSGYSGQPVIRIEEPDADKSSNRAQLEILHIISSEPVLVAKAALHEKNTWLTSPFVVLTSNSKDVSVNLNEPAAYFRRFRDIEVTTEGERKTDFSHLRFKVLPPSEYATGNPGAENLNYKQLIKWLIKDSTRHFGNDSVVQKFAQDMYEKYMLNDNTKTAGDDSDTEEDDPDYIPSTSFEPTPTEIALFDQQIEQMKAINTFVELSKPTVFKKKIVIETDNIHSEEESDEEDKDDVVSFILKKEHVEEATKTLQVDKFPVDVKEHRDTMEVIEKMLARPIQADTIMLIGALVHKHGEENIYAGLRDIEGEPFQGLAEEVKADFAGLTDEFLDEMPNLWISQLFRLSLAAYYNHLLRTCSTNPFPKSFERVQAAYKKANLLDRFTRFIERTSCKYLQYVRSLPRIAQAIIALFVGYAGYRTIKFLIGLITPLFSSFDGKVNNTVSAIFQKCGLDRAIATVTDKATTYVNAAHETFIAIGNKIYRVITRQAPGGETIQQLNEVTASYDGSAHAKATPSVAAAKISPSALQTAAGDNAITSLVSLLKPNFGILSGHWETEGKNMFYAINVLPIGGQYFITTRHQWQVLCSYKATEFAIQTSTYYAPILMADIKPFNLKKDCDVVILQLTGSRLPSGKAIYKQFIQRAALHQYTRCRVQTIRANPNDNYRAPIECHRAKDYLFAETLACIDAGRVEAKNARLGITFTTSDSYRYTGALIGSCGMPVLCSEQSCGKIIGIHVAGDTSTNTGHCAIITREDLEEFFEWNKTVPICSPDTAGMPVPAEHRLLGQGDFAIFSDPLPKEMQSFMPSSQDFQKMPTFEVYQENDREPAPLSDFDKRNVHNETILKNCSAKYKDISKPFESKYLAMFRQGMGHEINSLAGNRIGLLTIDQAINGIPDTHVERMNMDSSAGYPFSSWPEVKNRVGKRGLFNECGTQLEPYYVPTARFSEAIDMLWDSWKEGDRMLTCYRDAQKVELLPLKKTRPYLFVKRATGEETTPVPIYVGPKFDRIDIPKKDEQLEATRTFKCRLINTPPAHRTVIARVYNAGLNALLMENRHETGILPGINPMSEEWGRIVKRMHQFADTVNDTDFENFDGSHQRCVIQMISDIYFDYLMQFPEFSESRHHQTAQQACWDELITRHVIVKDLGYVVNHGLASGHDCTTQINCFAQIFYFFYAWMKIFEEIDPSLANYDDFRKYFAVVVYGDDGLWTAITELAHHVTAPVIANILKPHGISITGASKFHKGFEPPRPIEMVTFLSRSFIKHPIYANVYYATLKQESREALLNWAYIKKRTMFEAVADNVDQYLRHSFPLGRNFYNDRVASLLKTIPTYLTGVKLPSWEQLEEEFLQAWGLSQWTPQCELPENRRPAVQTIVSNSGNYGLIAVNYKNNYMFETY